MPAPIPVNITPAKMQEILDQLRTYAANLGIDYAVVLGIVEDELANVAKGGQPPDWPAVRARIKERSEAQAETPPPPGATWERRTVLDAGIIREERRAVGPWQTVSERPA